MDLASFEMFNKVLGRVYEAGIILFLLFVIAGMLIYIFFLFKQKKVYEIKFSGVSDVESLYQEILVRSADEEQNIRVLSDKCNEKKQVLEKLLIDISIYNKEYSEHCHIDDLRKKYKEKKVIFDQLIEDIAIYDEDIQLAELGVYKPHFIFDTSEEYKKLFG